MFMSYQIKNSEQCTLTVKDCSHSAYLTIKPSRQNKGMGLNVVAVFGYENDDISIILHFYTAQISKHKETKCV